MKDFVGQELNEGDTVVYATRAAPYLLRGPYKVYAFGDGGMVHLEAINPQMRGCGAPCWKLVKVCV